MTYHDLNAEELRVRRKLAGVLFWVVAAIVIIFLGVNAIPQRDKPDDSVALEPLEGSSSSNMADALKLKKDVGDGFIQPEEQRARAAIIPAPQPTVTPAPLKPAGQPREAAVTPAPLKPAGQPSVAAVTPAPLKPAGQPSEAAATPAPLKPPGHPSEAAATPAPLKPAGQPSVAAATPAPLKPTGQPSVAAVTPAPLKPTGQPSEAAATPAPLKSAGQPSVPVVTPAPPEMARRHAAAPKERAFTRERCRKQRIQMRKFYSALYSPIRVDIRELKARQGNLD